MHAVRVHRGTGWYRPAHGAAGLTGPGTGGIGTSLRAGGLAGSHRRVDGRAGSRASLGSGRVRAPLGTGHVAGAGSARTAVRVAGGVRPPNRSARVAGTHTRCVGGRTGAAHRTARLARSHGPLHRVAGSRSPWSAVRVGPLHRVAGSRSPRCAVRVGPRSHPGLLTGVRAVLGRVLRGPRPGSGVFARMDSALWRILWRILRRVLGRPRPRAGLLRTPLTRRRARGRTVLLGFGPAPPAGLVGRLAAGEVLRSGLPLVGGRLRQ
ncbi:hypothetical protein ADL03_44215 [Nocardia sp. NRRL S-836]|nr:hypothetical protein ADL03_44215 [Nocardia sp. NRRL S-836]